MKTAGTGGLSVRQKNLVLLKASEYLSQPTDTHHCLQLLAKALGLDAGLVHEYLSRLYDLNALCTSPVDGDEAMPEAVEPVNDAVRSGPISLQITPMKRQSSQEQAPLAEDEIAEDEVEEDEEEEEDDGELGDEAEEGPGEQEDGSVRLTRARRSASQAEIVLTPVKRARRR